MSWTGKAKKGIRIDQLLVARGLAQSRETAQRLILAGKVFVDQQPAKKPGQLVREDQALSVTQALKYVSRGGLKLEKALKDFDIAADGIIALDVGASTGGFTDCLLQNGAQKVYAVDVGYGQLAWKLRTDGRVVLFERTNAKNLTPEMFPHKPRLAVMDVSFIGAEKVLEPLTNIVEEVVLLLKPQFQAGPELVPSGGVIRDPKTHRKVLLDFFDSLRGWNVHGLIPSPVEGASGNREFLLHLKKSKGWDRNQFESAVNDIVS
jgi:23S rRNA (cytidine1920-2'-O)/16S rRNA (cytidine1409-2'-O)-methyltransferase